MEKRAVCLPNQITKKVFFSSCSISRESKVPSVAGREWGQLLLGEQCWLWIDYCASLLLLSFNLQLMKAANTMMVAWCCLRTTKLPF